MSRQNLTKLYNDLELLYFELDFLNNSLWHYTYKRQSNWERDFRLYQLEQIRDRIPQVNQFINEVKSDIQIEKSKLNNSYDYDSYDYDEYCVSEEYYNEEE